MSSKPSRSTRRRAGRGQLRRNTNIDAVTVEEPFTFSQPNGTSDNNKNNATSVGDSSSDGNTVGDGCYVSCTVQNRRYYGVLIDQNALKAASELYFKDEAASLDTNRRMMTLLQNTTTEEKQESSTTTTMAGTKRPLTPTADELGAKKLAKISEPVGDDKKLAKISEPIGDDKKLAKISEPVGDPSSITSNSKAVDYENTPQVLKFRYIDPTHSGDKTGPGYRRLLATYANISAASEASPSLATQIHNACQSGGAFVNDYYYQYQTPPAVLSTALVSGTSQATNAAGIRCSASFHSFLHDTILPPWYPLSNTPQQQSKILTMLQMKKNNKGGIDWDNTDKDVEKLAQGGLPQVTMQPRAGFRVGVIGGGLAGLGACFELLRLADLERVNIEVVLIEARDRVGGRAMTDTTSLKGKEGEAFPVDLGAGWIHGIDQNPLTELAKESEIDFLRHSDEVKMLGGKMREVDRHVDKTMGDLFDDLLDDAAEECWNRGESITKNDLRFQKAVRWYASVLTPSSNNTTTKPLRPTCVDVPIHRHSTDISIDHAIGIVTRKRKEVLNLTKQEQNLLMWNTKNTEYALGANICDLSMKYWDADERHAFKGDHVLLRQGYSKISDNLFEKCQSKDNFKSLLNFPVGKIEYGVNSTTVPYLNIAGRVRQSIELSDACRVTSKDGSRSEAFDFTICCLPLGVLKDKQLTFEPALPAFKRDAIDVVGFGLLNKVYLQFPHAFWRRPGKREFARGTPFLSDEQDLFGNASSHNPHHYMFLDVGKIVTGNVNPASPAILMTMISGVEAVNAEQHSPETQIQNVMSTLRHLFSDTNVPDPAAYKITTWGSDPYSRGSYTFLPPGATDQDYQILQSAINASNEATILGDNASTMRLFFAGEHTTALHPSMAHGAYLSGVRAAKEVVDSSAVMGMLSKGGDGNVLTGADRLIPVSVYRMKHPNEAVECHFCRVPGGRASLGGLIAFRRNGRQVLVHHNCAVYSPEVEVIDDVWRNVIKAVNRGKQLNCALCKRSGATIGCDEYQCHRSFHFGCCEDTGWNFQTMGKMFLCDVHRAKRDKAGDEHGDNPISIAYYRSKNPTAQIKCSLCGNMGDDARRGRLMGFQRGIRQLLIHHNCARYSTNVAEMGGTYDEDDELFQNIFETVAKKKYCQSCNADGATVQCVTCDRSYHFTCAEDTQWDFKKMKEDFKCPNCRGTTNNNNTNTNASSVSQSKEGSSDAIMHDLFVSGSKTFNEDKEENLTKMNHLQQQQQNTSANDKGSSSTPSASHKNENVSSDEDDSESDYESNDDSMLQPFDVDPHIADDEIGRSHIIHQQIYARRKSVSDPWNIYLAVERGTAAMTTTLRVHSKGDCPYGMAKGDIIISINGIKVGSQMLGTIGEVLTMMRGAVDLKIEVIRKPSTH